MLLNHFLHIINSRSTNTNPKPFPIDFLPYTNMAQNQIGFNLFIKGALDCKWQRIQEKYISQERFTKQYNIRRWIQRVAELLLNHCVAQYKERCNIINAEISMYLNIVLNIFEHDTISNINEWVKNITIAIDHNNNKIKEVASDIREFSQRQKLHRDQKINVFKNIA